MSGKEKKNSSNVSDSVVRSIADHLFNTVGANTKSIGFFKKIAKRLKETDGVKHTPNAVMALWKTRIKPEVGFYLLPLADEIGMPPSMDAISATNRSVVGTHRLSAAQILHIERVYAKCCWKPIGHVRVAEYINRNWALTVSVRQVLEFAINKFKMCIKPASPNASSGTRGTLLALHTHVPPVKRRCKERFLYKSALMFFNEPVYVSHPKPEELGYFAPNKLPKTPILRGVNVFIHLTEINWLHWTECHRIEFLVKCYGGTVFPHEEDVGEWKSTLVVMVGENLTIAQRFALEHKCQIFKSEIIYDCIRCGQKFDASQKFNFQVQFA